MKFLLLIGLFLVLLQGDELARVTSIVEDITQLQRDYKDSQQKLEMISLENKKLKNTIKNLKIKIKEDNKLLKSKEKLNKNPKKQNKKSLKVKENTLKSMCYTELKEKNTFPKLMMKNHTIQYFRASAFRLNKDSNIYNKIDGSVIAQWEVKRSFTSNQRTKNWIKITGYFINKVWQKSQKSMWIRADDVQQR